MPRVFISNTKVQESGDIIIDASFDVSNFVAEQQKSGDTTFIIDVHSKFKEAEKMQQQGGVIIYRHLLKQFEKCQDKLKVVFYSPISKKDLASLKPENYVLTLLPFVELFPKDENGNDIPNWNFKDALETAEKENCPQFNNASENLLSGWALNKKDSVKTIYHPVGEKEKSRRVTFIDDQIKEWEKTYREIFEPKADIRTVFYNKNLLPIGRFSYEKISNLENLVRQSALIVSDFYLEENHESNNWMSSKELSTKSGFQLFQKIKGTADTDGFHKGVPIVMHTSSNKIQYYKFLDANGVDNWFIKDTRTDATVNEKKENYYAFKKGIEDFTYEENSELYAILKKLWDEILELEENNDILWWYSAASDPIEYDVNSRLGGAIETVTISSATIESKEIVIALLKDSWMALRSVLNKEANFSKSIGSSDRNFTPSAICCNLGKLFEFFGFDQGMDFNFFFRFLFSARNAASHYNDYDQIELADCLIYFDSWLSALKCKATDLSETKLFGKFHSSEEIMVQGSTTKARDSFNYRLLFVYIQYYNSHYLKENTLAHRILKRRIPELLNAANKNVLFNEIESDILIGYSRGKLLKKAGDNLLVYKWTSTGNHYKIHEATDKKFFITNNA